jgi:hypothetical protein
VVAVAAGAVPVGGRSEWARRRQAAAVASGATRKGGGAYSGGLVSWRWKRRAF